MGQEKECRTSGCRLLWVTGETCLRQQRRGARMASEGLADLRESGIAVDCRHLHLPCPFYCGVVVFMVIGISTHKETNPQAIVALQPSHQFHCLHCCQCDSKLDLPVHGIVVVKCARGADFKASLSVINIGIAVIAIVVSLCCLS